MKKNWKQYKDDLDISADFVRGYNFSIMNTTGFKEIWLVIIEFNEDFRK